jgi:hypothetical protein
MVLKEEKGRKGKEMTDRQTVRQSNRETNINHEDE